MQIGPRIRIGGTVGKIGQTIKEHIPSPASIIGGAIIPGGALVGSALNHSTESDLQKGLANTPLALAGTHMLGNGPDTSGAGVPGDGTGVPGDPATGTAGADPSLVDQAIAALKAGGSAFMDFVKAHGVDALQVAAIANQAWRQTQSDKYAKQALSGVEDRYNAKEPLRTAGMAGMLNPSANTPDLSALRTIAGPNSGNPFAPKTLPVAGLPSGQAIGQPTPTVNGAPPGPVYMPGGDQTAPRPLPIQRTPMSGAIPRLPMTGG